MPSAARLAISLAASLTLSLSAGLAASEGVTTTAGAERPVAADTLAAVKARGMLRCGVGGDVRGLSYRNDSGQWSGLDVDFCRAVAAVALGRPELVEFVPLSVEERLPALRDDRVDLLARNTTWTGSRELTEGVRFVGVLYLDGQGFMVPRSTSILSTLDLNDARICAIANTTSAANAKDYFTLHQMTMSLKLYPDLDTAAAAYAAGDCTTLTGDQSQLHGLRVTLEHPEANRILPETISKEPLSPAVRKGDERWFDLVRWTLFTLIEAEELRINAKNLIMAKTRASTAPVRALLDLDGTTGEALGVAPEWGYRALLAVGNYGDMFARNLGEGSELGVKRGLNALWRDGGLLYAPPMR